MCFLDESNGWKIYGLEYVLALKMLHDRGFRIPKELEIIKNTLSEFFILMFGENNCDWIPGRPEEDSLQKLFEVDGEYENDDIVDILEEYYSKDHGLVKIIIDDLGGLKTKQYVKLMEILTELCPTDEDILNLGEFPWYEMFRSINWLTEVNGTVTGLLIHIVDIKVCCDESPQGLGHYYRTFVRFWDQLQTYKTINH